MSYLVQNTAGNIIASVTDGQVNNTDTSLQLVGKGYQTYAGVIAEDLVALAENFADVTPPLKPLPGQLWYDKSTKTLHVYNGTVFKPVNAVKVDNDTPVTNQTGDLWYDSASHQLKFFMDGNFEVVAPAYSLQQNKSGQEVVTLLDIHGASHTAVTLSANGFVMAIISADLPYTIMSPPIAGFHDVGTGITLSTLFSPRLIGTATHALTADNLASADGFMSAVADTGTTGNIYVNNDDGITIGAEREWRLGVDAGKGFITSDNGIDITTPDEGIVHINDSYIGVGMATPDSGNRIDTDGQIKTATVEANSYKFPSVTGSSIQHTPNDTISEKIVIQINGHNSITISADGDVTIAGNLVANGAVTVDLGGHITEPLNLDYLPTAPAHAVNKDYVDKYAMPVGSIIQWYGDLAVVPTGWHLCDGTNGTPDLRDTFVIGAGLNYNIGDTTGVNEHNFLSAASGSHGHSGTTDPGGNHRHSGNTDPHVLSIDELPEHAHPYQDAISLVENSPTVPGRTGNADPNLTSFYTYPFQPDPGVRIPPGSQTTDQANQSSAINAYPQWNSAGTNSLYQYPIRDRNGTRIRYYSEQGLWGGIYPFYVPYQWNYYYNGYSYYGYAYEGYASYPTDWFGQETDVGSIEISRATYPLGANVGHTHSIRESGTHTHGVNTVAGGLHQHQLAFDNKPKSFALAYIMKLG